jgi:hypothetical protein
LEQVLLLLKDLSVREPLASEQACRKMLEDLFGSTRQSLKEFMASISQPANLPEVDLYDFDEQDEKKLDFHSVKQDDRDDTVTPSSNREFRTHIAECLLQRWINKTYKVV